METVVFGFVCQCYTRTYNSAKERTVISRQIVFDDDNDRVITSHAYICYRYLGILTEYHIDRSRSPPPFQS